MKCLSHWETAAASLALPRAYQLGWRLYKSGRNATKVIKKLGKRPAKDHIKSTIDTAIDGARIEIAFTVVDVGQHLAKGTILAIECGRYILLDDTPTGRSFSKDLVKALQEQADKWGIKVNPNNLIAYNAVDDLRILPES